MYGVRRSHFHFNYYQINTILSRSISKIAGPEISTWAGGANRVAIISDDPATAMAEAEDINKRLDAWRLGPLSHGA